MQFEVWVPKEALKNMIFFTDSIRFREALLYATQTHALQFRKGTNIPYVSHLYAVASLVMECGGDEDEVIAALLHDAVEDQGGMERLKEIQQNFGDRVADVVCGCSEMYTKSKPPWRERKERYIAHIKDPETSSSVVLVSCADKLHNARSILSDYRIEGEKLWERFNASSEQILWFNRTLANVFLERAKIPLAAELDRVVLDIERLVQERKTVSSP